MAKKFQTLLDKMPADARARIKKGVEADLRSMALSELRQARQMTQKEVAQELHIEQAGVSRIEKQTDIYISTLRRFVQATGGTLQIVASYPDGDVRIEQFAEFDEQSAKR